MFADTEINTNRMSTFDVKITDNSLRPARADRIREVHYEVLVILESKMFAYFSEQLLSVIDVIRQLKKDRFRFHALRLVPW